MRFQPLSFEAQGAFGPGVRRLMAIARASFAEDEDRMRGAGGAGDAGVRTWMAPTEYQYRLQRLVVALARWNSKMVMMALDGMRAPGLMVLAPVDTGGVSLADEWWAVPDVGAGDDGGARGDVGSV